MTRNDITDEVCGQNAEEGLGAKHDRFQLRQVREEHGRVPQEGRTAELHALQLRQP